MATILEVNLVCPSGTAARSFERCLAILEMEMGYLFNLDWFSLLWMTSLNLDSVLLVRKEYSCVERKVL